MANISLKGNGEIRTGTKVIDAPHKGGIITFVYPMYGSDYRGKVMGEIDSDNLLRPTIAQTFSLIDLVLNNPDEAHCSDIINKLRANSFWSSTESLSNRDGVIVYDNINGKMHANSKNLMKRLESGDKSVRFVPKGFKTGVMPISKFLKHPYLIAQVGEDMLEVAERIARSCNNREAYIYGFGSANQDMITYTVIGVSEYGGCFNYLLDLGTSYRDDGYWSDRGSWVGRLGCAFGVLDSGEAGRR